MFRGNNNTYPTSEMMDDFWRRSMKLHQERFSSTSINGERCNFDVLMGTDPANKHKLFGLCCGCRKCSAKP